MPHGVNGKFPTIQPSCKTSKLGNLEVFWQDVCFKPFLVTDDEATSMGKPCYDVRMRIGVQDEH